MIVAIFSLCGVLLGVVLQYAFGRALESRKQLTVQRSLAYSDFLKAVTLVAQNGPSKENLALAADAKVRICIHGSAHAIRHLSQFETVGPNTGLPAGRATIVALVKQMRMDIGKSDSAIDDNDFQGILFGGQSKG